MISKLLLISPREGTVCYNTETDFTLAIMNHTAPTLLAVDGNYAKAHDLDVDNVLPFAFPWGIGGPDMNRKTALFSD